MLSLYFYTSYYFLCRCLLSQCCSAITRCCIFLKTFKFQGSFSNKLRHFDIFSLRILTQDVYFELIPYVALRIFQCFTSVLSSAAKTFDFSAFRVA